MARMCDDIMGIDGKKETLKFEVRIISIWECTNRDRNSQLEIVVMDCKGDKIQIVVRNDEVQRWKEKLLDGHTYFMHNFKVVPNEGQYKVCDHPFKLLFINGTTVIDSDIPNVPINKYMFKEFSDILSGNYRRDMLVDIIGAVVKITYQGLHKNPKKVAFHLLSLSDDLLICTLWEDYAVRFLEYYNQSSNLQSFVIILTNARIKEAQGVFPVSISNSFYGSKLVMNEDVAEIQHFKAKFGGSRLAAISLDSHNPIASVGNSPLGLTTFSAGSSQGTGWTEFSEQDKFMYKAAPKTLAEINAVTKESFFVTVATIGKIVVGPHGWYYYSCSQCNKKADNIIDPFTCQCGCYNKKAYLRYKLELEVYFNKYNAKFAFFDCVCCRIIGMTADELRKMAIDAGEPDDPRVYPEPLDRMLGYTMAFRIKVQPKFNNSSVMRMSDDPELMKLILAQFATKEGSCESAKLSSEDNLISLTDISLSGTAEHDPDVSNLVTPAKRHLAEMESDHALSSDLPSTKLSSTKVAKHIKTE